MPSTCLVLNWVLRHVCSHVCGSLCHCRGGGCPGARSAAGDPFCVSQQNGGLVVGMGKTLPIAFLLHFFLTSVLVWFVQRSTISPTSTCITPSVRFSYRLLPGMSQRACPVQEELCPREQLGLDPQFVGQGRLFGMRMG